MTEIKFCDNCNNLLFLYSDDEKNKLYLGCKLCETTKEFNQPKCIFNNNYNIDIQEIINHNKFLSEDITLPIINDKKIKCPNQNCSSLQKDKTNINYIKYDYHNIKYLYICKDCGQKLIIN